MAKSEIEKQRKALNKFRRGESNDLIIDRYVKGVRNLLKLYDRGDRRKELIDLIKSQSAELEAYKASKRS